MGLKDMFLKQMVKSKLKDLPADQQEKILKALEENPDFFTNLASEIQESIKSGKDQMSAMMEVVGKHRDELEKILKK